MDLLFTGLVAALLVAGWVWIWRSSRRGQRRRDRVVLSPHLDAGRVAATRDLVASTCALGAILAESVVRQRYPDAERLHPEEGGLASRFWSQLYRDGDLYIVVDTFSGDAALGWRTESDRAYEQGASNYLAQVTLYGALGADEHVAAVKAAVAEGRVVYLCVRVPITRVDGRSSLSTVDVAEFQT